MEELTRIADALERIADKLDMLTETGAEIEQDLDTLREQKQMEVSELDELATACGTSKKTLRNAKEELKKEKEIHMWSVGNNHTGKKYMISLTATDKRASKE